MPDPASVLVSEARAKLTEALGLIDALQGRDGGSPPDGVSQETFDSAVLDLMLFGKPAFPWSVDELARETQVADDTYDAVRRLTEAGLVHRLGEFVFPTRTARRAAQIEVGTV